MAAPGTLAHFKAWAKNLILDTGDPWVVEPFQAKIVKDILAGVEVVWIVVPEGNAKTTLMAGIALYHGDSEGWNVPSPEVPIGASSREQAEIMYRQAEGFVLRSGLQARFKCQEGYRRIKCLGTNGRIQVYAADARTGDGVIPTLALLDELHRHRDLRLYRTWRGKLGKRSGQLGVISTAGEPDSDFEETRAAILNGAKKVTRKGAYIRAESDGVVLHDYAVRDLKKINDMRSVAAANPLKSLNAKVLREKRRDPTLIDEHWLRFTCNIASQASGQAINAAEWDACRGQVRLEDADELFLGVDIGQVHDSSAVVQVGFVDERLHISSRIWTPTPGKPITVREVESHIIELAESEEVAEVAFDPMRFNRSAEVLEERSIMMVEFPQTDLRMHEASSTLLALIREGHLVHDGDPELRSHILAGVAAETDRGWRFSKKKSGTKRKIDALVALAMAGQRAVVAQGRARPSFEVLA